MRRWAALAVALVLAVAAIRVAGYDICVLMTPDNPLYTILGCEPPPCPECKYAS